MIRKIWLVVALTVGVGGTMTGCSHAQRNPHGPTPGVTEQTPAASSEVQGPPEPYGPPTPANAQSAPAEPAYGPEPVQYRPLVLVLGPGLARGYAHAGVLRALAEAKIPIAAILGTETGALMGALYAMNGNVNGFDWALLRFKEDVFKDRNPLSALLKSVSSGQKLESALDETLGSKDIADAKIPVRPMVASLSGKPELISSGSAAEAVRAAMADPGVFTSSKWKGEETVSAIAAKPYPVSEARGLNMGVVVVVDLLADIRPIAPSASARDKKTQQLMLAARKAGGREIKDADLVIRPELKDISFTEFEKNTEIVFRGKRAVKAQIQAIRRLVGMPEENHAGESP